MLTAFADATPQIAAVPIAVGNQIYLAFPTSVTKTGAAFVVKRSKGTLLLSDGPFEIAPAGSTASVIALGS